MQSFRFNFLRELITCVRFTKKQYFIAHTHKERTIVMHIHCKCTPTEFQFTVDLNVCVFNFQRFVCTMMHFRNGNNSKKKRFPRKCVFMVYDFVVCRYLLYSCAMAVCRVCQQTHSLDYNLPLKITEICNINFKIWYWIIAKVKLNQVFKKSEICFIELNSLQIGFTTHHQMNGAATATVATETNQRERIMRDGH